MKSLIAKHPIFSRSALFVIGVVVNFLVLSLFGVGLLSSARLIFSMFFGLFAVLLLSETINAAFGETILPTVEIRPGETPTDGPTFNQREKVVSSLCFMFMIAWFQISMK